MESGRRVVANVKQDIKQRVMREIHFRNVSEEKEIYQCIDVALLDNLKEQYLSMEEKMELRKEIFNGIRRLDVLQELLDDPEITEIMVNGYRDIFIEKHGAMYRWHKQFESADKLEDVIQQIVSKSNRMVNTANPIVDARLEDGSRVNVVLAPVSLDGAILTIRKFPKQAMTMEKLIELQSIDGETAAYLGRLVKEKYNIFISGGTGTGKTTFLNALSNYIPADERIITIEDSAELQIRNIPNLVRLEARNANVEGKNEITIRQLIKTALRMRPDRLIVGEIRDGAAFDMLQAMNTGHSGSLSTGHANSAEDMLKRMESMVLMGVDIPLESIRSQIASAIDVIVHLGRLPDKSRHIMHIIEILGYEDGKIKTKTLYRYEKEGERNTDGERKVDV